jgi:hypothetical protein
VVDTALKTYERSERASDEKPKDDVQQLSQFFLQSLAVAARGSGLFPRLSITRRPSIHGVTLLN